MVCQSALMYPAFGDLEPEPLSSPFLPNQLNHHAGTGAFFDILRTCFIVIYPFAKHSHCTEPWAFDYPT